MNGLDIKALKEKRAINWAALARNLGVHESTIHHTLADRQYFRNPRVRRGIAKALGVRIRDLWPPAPKVLAEGQGNGQQ